MTYKLVARWIRATTRRNVAFGLQQIDENVAIGLSIQLIYGARDQSSRAWLSIRPLPQRIGPYLQVADQISFGGERLLGFLDAPEQFAGGFEQQCTPALQRPHGLAHHLGIASGRTIGIECTL